MPHLGHPRLGRDGVLNLATRREALARIFCGILGAGCGLRSSRNQVGARSIDSIAHFKQVASFPRVVLVDAKGRSIRARSLVAHQTFVFFYPFSNTPAFLLNLGAPLAELSREGDPGSSVFGGVGPQNSVVAYMAICPHQQVFPTPAMSFMKYYPPGVPSAFGGRDRVITCCVHGSVFDPAEGGRVLQSPAEHPLGSIRLDWDANSDTLYAEGVAGQDSFDQFFQIVGPGAPVTKKTTVVRLEDYSKVVAGC